MKEIAKARYGAARATRDILLALLDPGFAPAAVPEEPDQVRAELAAAKAEVAAASEQVAAALAVAARLSRSLARDARAVESGEPATAARQPAPSAASAAAEVTAGLLELRADPLGADIRFLAAIEPADTVTLLAVLDGSAAVSEHRQLAIRLAGELLTELRAGGWPHDEASAAVPGNGEAGELIFDDSGAFLATYFADSEAEVKRRSAALAAGSA